MSNLFKSTVIKGTRITDFSNTSASVGNPLPFIYGAVPVDGQVIWAPLPPKEHVSKKRQGKGGVKQEVYTYTLSYAIEFCRGPIVKFLWIKRNGKVVHTTDPSAPIEDQEYAAKWAEKVSFYYGTTDQNPDSTIEAYEGSGNVSAFRRNAYIVVEDDDVTEGGGAVPTYEACVVAVGTLYLTSPLYPLEVIEGVEDASEVQRIGSMQAPADNMDDTSDLVGVELRQALTQYAMMPEGMNDDSDLQSVSLQDALVRYAMTPEGMNDDSTLQSIVLAQVLIRYQNYPPEGMNDDSDILGVSLT